MQSWRCRINADEVNTKFKKFPLDSYGHNHTKIIMFRKTQGSTEIRALQITFVQIQIEKARISVNFECPKIRDKRNRRLVKKYLNGYAHALNSSI